MVPPDSHRVPRAPWYSGFHLSLRSVSPTGLSPSMVDLSRSFGYRSFDPLWWSHDPEPPKRFGLGSSPFARRYSGNLVCFLFLWVLRCFTSPGTLSNCLEYPDFFRMGFPIRKSPDHRLLRTSPRSIAATLRPSSPFDVEASTIYS